LIIRSISGGTEIESFPHRHANTVRRGRNEFYCREFLLRPARSGEVRSRATRRRPRGSPHRYGGAVCHSRRAPGTPPGPSSHEKPATGASSLPPTVSSTGPPPCHSNSSSEANPVHATFARQQQERHAGDERSGRHGECPQVDGVATSRGNQPPSGGGLDGQRLGIRGYRFGQTSDPGRPPRAPPEVAGSARRGDIRPLWTLPVASVSLVTCVSFLLLRANARLAPGSLRRACALVRGRRPRAADVAVRTRPYGLCELGPGGPCTGARRRVADGAPLTRGDPRGCVVSPVLDFADSRWRSRNSRSRNSFLPRRTVLALTAPKLSISVPPENRADYQGGAPDRAFPFGLGHGPRRAPSPIIVVGGDSERPANSSWSTRLSTGKIPNG